MASAVAPKGGIPLAFFLKEHIASSSAAKEKAAAAAAAHRFFSTLCDDSTEDPSNVDTGDDRRRARSLAFAKLISGDADLFDEATKLSLLLSLMDMEGGGAASKIGFYPGGCVSKEDGDAVHLTVAMPGLGKEHVEMRAEKDVLVIKGEGDKDSAGGDDKVPARYSYRIDLSSQTQAFKMDQIKAEMKNGVLKVTVPKIKDEERKDVFQIKIE